MSRNMVALQNIKIVMDRFSTTHEGSTYKPTIVIKTLYYDLLEKEEHMVIVEIDAGMNSLSVYHDNRIVFSKIVWPSHIKKVLNRIHSYIIEKV